MIRRRDAMSREERELLAAARDGDEHASGGSSSRTAASCTPTATGCSAPSTTPRTRCRTRCCAPGAGCRASRAAARCARGCTGSRRTRAWTRSAAAQARARRSTTARPPTRATAPGEPLVESVWIEPYPDDGCSPTGARRPTPATSSARASSSRSSPRCSTCRPSQRAVLILREVLGFSAAGGRGRARHDAASVNSALQRARKTVDERLPEQSQQATLRALGDEALRDARRALRRRVGARRRRRASSRCSPRTPRCRCRRSRAGSAARERSRAFLARLPAVRRLAVAPRAAHANGQPAVGCYTWDETAGAYLPFALEVLTFAGGRIGEITAFVNRSTDVAARETFAQWPELAPAPQGVSFAAFDRPSRCPDEFRAAPGLDQHEHVRADPRWGLLALVLPPRRGRAALARA